MSALSEYAGTRELVVNLTLRELRSKYKKSVLGWTWSLLNPVASVLIYTIVFSVFLQVDPPRGDPSGLKSFVVFLLCALVPWNFMSSTMTLSLDSLVMNANLIKKVYFPRELLVASSIASLDVTFLIELGVLGGILLLVGNMIIPWIPVVLLLVVMLTVMMLGWGMVLAVCNVYFRDVKHFMNIVIMALFYSAPIVYPVTLVPETKEVLGVSVPVRDLYELNPIARFIEAFRAVLYDLRFPHWSTIVYLLGWTIGSLLIGWWVFGKLEPRLAGGSVSSKAAITVDGVSKRFRLYHERNQSLKIAVLRGGRARFEEFWALQDVSFEVPEGTTFGLIGENGSGKSTMLKCMAKILRPDKGSIEAFGKISALLELGAGFHPELSGRENVYLNGAILGLTKKQLDARFEGIVDFAGIEQFIDTPVKNYSSGMYVRLGFSVAINVDPDILLIDEVLAVGDAEFQRKCSEKIADFRQQGKTIVIVSHSLPSVRALCDEVALLEHGVLRDLGPAGPIIDHYLADAFADQDDAGGFVRWGSGEVRVERVEMLDAGGASITKAHTGDAVTLRIHYNASEPVRDVQFGSALNNIEGVAVTGPNSRHAGLAVDCLEGRGFVDYRVPRLLLLPGGYHFTVAIYDLAALHAYDHVERALRFDVEAGEPYEEVGVVSLGGTWEGEALSPLDARKRAG